MLNIELEKEITFDLPMGKYPATITNVKLINKQTRKGVQKWVRLIFDVQIPGMERLDCRAGRNFLLSFKPGSDLRNFLTSILGEQFFKDNSATVIDLEGILKGIGGEVLLNHFLGEGFDTPHVIVESLEPVTVLQHPSPAIENNTNKVHI